MSMTSITTDLSAIAALGTASFGLVDATKAFWGGISRSGFSYIRSQIQPLFGKSASPNDRATPLAFGALLDTLLANWINGTALDDQKAIAKTLLKLRLSPANSDDYAKATGVDPATLKSIAVKLRDATSLLPSEADAFGRFDLILTALLDEGYQRAAQVYRNSCKLLACLFSIAIAVFAGYELYASGISLVGPQAPTYWWHHDMWTAFLIGLLATPLAPIAKDLTTALIAGVQAVQSVGTGK